MRCAAPQGELCSVVLMHVFVVHHPAWSPARCVLCFSASCTSVKVWVELQVGRAHAAGAAIGCGPVAVQCRHVGCARATPLSCPSVHITLGCWVPVHLSCLHPCLVQVLTRDDASIWPGMSAPAKQAVKSEMLACIKEEQQRGVTKKVGGFVQACLLLLSLSSCITEQQQRGVTKVGGFVLGVWLISQLQLHMRRCWPADCWLL